MEHGSGPFGTTQPTSNFNVWNVTFDQAVGAVAVGAGDLYSHVTQVVMASFGLNNGLGPWPSFPVYTNSLYIKNGGGGWGTYSLPSGGNVVMSTFAQFTGTSTGVLTGDYRPAGLALSNLFPPVDLVDIRYNTRQATDAPGPCSRTTAPAPSYPW